MRKTVIGVMGKGKEAIASDLQTAEELGKLIAEQGWILLTGGRNVGVMDAACVGAKSANGLTVGILPNNNSEGISSCVDIAIITDMGNARNNINVLSSDIVIACGMGAGTASEIALALKTHKKVILLNPETETRIFFEKISPENIYVAQNPVEAISIVKAIL